MKGQIWYYKRVKIPILLSFDKLFRVHWYKKNRIRPELHPCRPHRRNLLRRRMLIPRSAGKGHQLLILSVNVFGVSIKDYPVIHFPGAQGCLVPLNNFLPAPLLTVYFPGF